MSQKVYWDKNILSWSKQYISEIKYDEKIDANFFVKLLHEIFIFKIESKVLVHRMNNAIGFIENYKSLDLTIKDIGAGTGKISRYALNKFKKLFILDFSNSSIDFLKKDFKNENVVVKLSDVTKDLLPTTNLSLCLGVTPYISKDKINFALENIINSSEIVLINYLHKYNIFNLIRLIFPFLNVRSVTFYSKKEIRQIYKKHNISIIKTSKLGTGFIDVIKTTK